MKKNTIVETSESTNNVTSADPQAQNHKQTISYNHALLGNNLEHTAVPDNVIGVSLDETMIVSLSDQAKIESNHTNTAMCNVSEGHELYDVSVDDNSHLAELNFHVQLSSQSNHVQCLRLS